MTPEPQHENPYRVAPFGALPALDPATIVPLIGAERVIPLVDRVVGEVRMDGQSAKVLAASLTDDGGVGLLNLVGPATSLGALAGRLHQNKPLTLALGDDFGATGIALKRLVGASYTQQHARIRRIGQVNLLIHPTTMSIDEGVRSPAVPAISRDKDGRPLPPGSGPEVALASRFVIANHDDETPSLLRLLGTLYGMRVPLPASTADQARWAATLWAYGLATPVRPGANQRLIMPLRPLGVRVWELCGNPRIWWALLAQLVEQQLLTLMHLTA